MTEELALTESKTLREQHAGRTDVLDKVKALSLLPDNIHATTDIVADFYEVPASTIESLAANNSAELESNGRRVLKGAELRKFATPFGGVANLGLSPKARTLAVFGRRAILNVGMLLRDSDVARQVRTYLLDAERAPVPETLSAALRAYADEVDAREVAERKAAKGEAFKVAIEAGDGLSIRAFHKKYFSEVGERAFFAHLYARGYLIDQRGKGETRDDGTVRDGSQHRHPSAKGKPFFYLHGAGVFGDKRRESTRVRPGDAELGLKSRLIADGLQANNNDTGQPREIEGGAP